MESLKVSYHNCYRSSVKHGKVRDACAVFNQHLQSKEVSMNVINGFNKHLTNMYLKSFASPEYAPKPKRQYGWLLSSQ